jgi:hypothetical protein
MLERMTLRSRAIIGELLNVPPHRPQVVYFRRSYKTCVTVLAASSMTQTGNFSEVTHECQHLWVIRITDQLQPMTLQRNPTSLTSGNFLNNCWLILNDGRKFSQNQLLAHSKTCKSARNRFTLKP